MHFELLRAPPPPPPTLSTPLTMIMGCGIGWVMLINILLVLLVHWLTLVLLVISLALVIGLVL